MPLTTNGDTAKRIKDKIINCKKFILLATPGAIESKWCNWELEFEDANRLESGIIALLFVNLSNVYNYGNEYMQNYPYIVLEDGKSIYSDGKIISAGYYVVTSVENRRKYKTLRQWLIS